MHAWRASFEARMDQMHDACMSAFHSRAWGLEEDVAAHVQWSEAAGKNKLTADEVNDIRGMLQVRGLLPPPIYIYAYARAHINTPISIQVHKHGRL